MVLLFIVREPTMFLPARRYASAGTSYAPVSISPRSVCVCPSQVGVLLQRMDRSRWFWPYLASPKIKVPVLPSGTSEIMDLENFATASRSCCQQNSSTVELVDHTNDSRQSTLPQTVLCSDSVAVFKIRLKTFLFSRAFSSFSAH